MSESPKNSIGNSIKLYFFPSLVTILAMLIWRDVSELRSDVKSLLAQSNVDKTEILNLKRDVEMLNHQIFKTPVSHAVTEQKKESEPFVIISMDRLFKHEEEFDLNKYLLPNKKT